MAAAEGQSRLFADLFDAPEAPVWLCRTDGVLFACNKAYAKAAEAEMPDIDSTRSANRSARGSNGSANCPPVPRAKGSRAAACCMSSSPARAPGLDLSLVKSFINLHGGGIELTSAPGQGTPVTCRLPAQGVSEIVQPEQAEKPGAE